MKELRVPKDLTIHDVQRISDGRSNQIDEHAPQTKQIDGDAPQERKLTRMHFCITQLKAQGPSRTCNESKEEEEEEDAPQESNVMGMRRRKAVW